MANWVRDFLAENPELSNRVVKRARHALHTRNDDGAVTARFTGTPMHYQDERGEWHAIDTAIRRLPNGKLGAPGIPIEFDDDGQVNLEGYSQVTRRVGIYNANAGEFVQAFDLPTPKIDDDKLVRETGIYKHVITLKEEGLREELIIKEKPAADTKLEDNTNLWLVMDTTITGQEFEDGLVDDEAEFKKGEFRFVPPKAGDANDNELSVKRHARKIEGKQHLLTGVRLDALNDAVYPVTIDPDFTGDTTDGFIYGRNTNYSTARSTSYIGDQTAIAFYAGQQYSYPNYIVYRGFVLFDTSSIPDSANITQVNLKLTVRQNGSTTDFDVQIVKTDWSNNTNFSNVTQRENAYDNCLADDADDNIWRNTSGMSLDTPYTSGNLSTAWVSKTGTTYYGLRSNRDKSAITPSGNEWIELYSQEATTESYRPVLVVEYTTVTAYTLVCAAGSYSLAGTACTLTVQRNYVLSCASATYTLTGTACTLTVQRNYVLSCASATYTLTGTACTLTVQRNYVLSCASATYTLTGSDAGFEIHHTLAIDGGSYALAGVDVGLHRGYTLSASAGSFSLTGADVTLISTRILSAGAGSYALTGTGTGLHRGYTLSCNAGSYALAGVGAELYRGYLLSVIGGNYILTGVDIAFEVLQRHYIHRLDAGEYTLTGKDAILTSARILSVDAGDYTLSGTEASLRSERILSADTGSYILAGADVTLKSERTLSVDAGGYTLTGADCTLTPQFNYTLALEAGSYALTGSDIVLQHGFLLAVDSGAYSLVGLDVSLFAGRIIIAEAGAYILAGSDATFLFTMITPACRTLTIEAENRTLTIEACKDGG